MFRLLRVAAWPLVVKVPVLVAGLMVAVAVAISQIVLWRFVHDQESNLGQLSSAYLDGLSGAVLPAIIRGDVWEVFDALDRARRTPYAGVQSRFAVVELPSGTVLAASDPVRFPVESAVPDERTMQQPIVSATANSSFDARLRRTGYRNDFSTPPAPLDFSRYGRAILQVAALARPAHYPVQPN
jgi:hypothetical protein